MSIIDDINELRDDARRLDERVMALHGHSAFERPSPFARSHAGEMRANLQLTHRHLEDARMRLGKVIQAYEGRDIFDVPQVQEAIRAERGE